MGAFTTDARMAYRRALTFHTVSALPGAMIVVLFNTYFLIYATDMLLIASAVATPTLAQAQGELPNLPRQQYVAQMDAEFARLDGDGNGMVTPKEIVAT